MNNRSADSETDAEWEALKHKMYTQEAIVPLLKKPETGYMEDSPYRCRDSVDYQYHAGYPTGYLPVYTKNVLCLRSPVGDKSKIQLSDGTVVWLNSGSVLRYSNHFNTADRVVELEGEGYFEVTKRNGKRFTVKTQEYDVVVKGTKV